MRFERERARNRTAHVDVIIVERKRRLLACCFRDPTPIFAAPPVDPVDRNVAPETALGDIAAVEFGQEEGVWVSADVGESEYTNDDLVIVCHRSSCQARAFVLMHIDQLQYAPRVAVGRDHVEKDGHTNRRMRHNLHMRILGEDGAKQRIVSNSALMAHGRQQHQCYVYRPHYIRYTRPLHSSQEAQV